MTMKKYETANSKVIKKYISIGIPLLFFLSLLLPNCGKETTEPEPVVYPDSNLSFNEHIHPIFLGNCATSGCHESVSPARGLDLETLTPSFISVNGPMIIPFNASQSRLYQRKRHSPQKDAGRTHAGRSGKRPGHQARSNAAGIL